MNLYIGTSGYSYKEWKGSFYPEKLSAKKMLAFYGGQFRSVEINSSFRRMPDPSVLEAWASEVPVDFKFVLKAPQQITHFQRLKNSEETVAKFLEVAAVLKKRLGPLLFQLPPNMKKDAERLRDFLKLVPRGGAAFEFRHESWFDDEIFDLLRRRRAALCVAEAEEGPEVPFVSTSDFGYLRLRRPDYREAELKSWVQRVRQQNWRSVFVFFKHEDEGKAPFLARKFLMLLARKSGGRISTKPRP